MTLTPEAIAAYKTLLTNPSEHGLNFTPIGECFVPSDETIAKHVLAESYIKHINKPLPKLILYIIMDELFGQCTEKDENGDLGYKLTFNQ